MSFLTGKFKKYMTVIHSETTPLTVYHRSSPSITVQNYHCHPSPSVTVSKRLIPFKTTFCLFLTVMDGNRN
jgi:hypothetical protein